MRRTPVVALALVAVLALAAACSPSSPDAVSARDRIRAAADATRDAGTARVVLAVAETVGGSEEQRGVGGRDVERLRAEGLVDFEQGRVALTFDAGEGASPLVAGGSGEIRLVDGVYFVRVAGLTEQLGREWVRIDPDGALATLARDSGLQAAVGAELPALLDLLDGARDARRVGRAPVGGVQTTHYTAALDVRRAARRAEGPTRESLERLAGRLADGVLPIEVWLDDDDRVRRVTLPDAQLPGGAQEEPPRMHTVIELSDFGLDVDVQAPPPEAVIDPTTAG